MSPPPMCIAKPASHRMTRTTMMSQSKFPMRLSNSYSRASRTSTSSWKLERHHGWPMQPAVRAADDQAQREPGPTRLHKTELPRVRRHIESQAAFERTAWRDKRGDRHSGLTFLLQPPLPGCRKVETSALRVEEVD